MIIKRRTLAVKVDESLVKGLEGVVAESARPLSPTSRAALVAEVLKLAKRIFDASDELTLTTRSELENFRDELVRRTDELAVANVVAAVRDLVDDDVKVERSKDDFGRQFFTLRLRRGGVPDRVTRIRSTGELAIPFPAASA